MTDPRPYRTAAAILAGGRGSRMGGACPKPLMPLGGRPLIGWVVAALPPEVEVRLVNAGAPEPYAAFGLPVVPDRRGEYAGPLAGLEAAAAWLAGSAPDITHLLALPADTPFLTRESLREFLARPPALARIARQDGRLHPTVGLWPLALLSGLPAYLDGPSNRSIMGFLETIGFEALDLAGDDLFLNVNTPLELEAAELRLADG